jgi:hypothetical protein
LPGSPQEFARKSPISPVSFVTGLGVKNVSYGTTQEYDNMMNALSAIIFFEVERIL